MSQYKTLALELISILSLLSFLSWFCPKVIVNLNMYISCIWVRRSHIAKGAICLIACLFVWSPLDWKRSSVIWVRHPQASEKPFTEFSSKISTQGRNLTLSFSIFSQCSMHQYLAFTFTLLIFYPCPKLHFPFLSFFSRLSPFDATISSVYFHFSPFSSYLTIFDASIFSFHFYLSSYITSQCPLGQNASFCRFLCFSMSFSLIDH